MAINYNSCISEEMKEEVENLTAYPAQDADLIESGLTGAMESQPDIKYPPPEGGVTQPIVGKQRITGSCQYFMSGLPAVCSHWNSANLECTYSFSDVKDRPSGYGVGHCDMLGRRKWCSKYEASGDDNPNEFVCIAPCPERSGLGIQQEGVSSSLSYRSVLPSEIQGYSEEEGVGKCDGWGFGRGNHTKYQDATIQDIYFDTPICRFWRPKQMGFGALQPRPYHGSDEAGRPFDPKVNYIPQTLAELHDGSVADPLSSRVGGLFKLPYHFEVFNARAMYQRCAHWQGSGPGTFRMKEYGSDPLSFSVELDVDPSTSCQCEESDYCDPYRTVKEDWEEGVPAFLQDVWAEYGGIICNGAKPECPCYTGRWLYCIDNAMRQGMRFSVDQVYELRFWASNWSSQEEYDKFYTAKPGVTSPITGHADESTADMYTFTHWDKLDPLDPNESIMIGNKHHMCMPAPLNMRQYDPDDYVTITRVEYPRVGKAQGTNLAGSDVTFPTLVRHLENPDDFVPDILVIYPYSQKDPWDIVICDQDEDKEMGVHDFNTIGTPYISVVGHVPGAMDRDVYVINDDLSEVFSNSKARKYMDTYVRSIQIPKGDEARKFNEAVDEAIDECIKEGTAIFTGSTNDYGFFQQDDVELKLNFENNLYVICKFDSSNYTYRKVQVRSRYWGAVIEQTSATHSYSGDVWQNTFPSWYTPACSITGKVTPIGKEGIVSTVFSVYSYYLLSLYGANSAYYSYVINEYTDTEEDLEQWVQIGPTGYIWAEIDNIEISYLWSFEIEEASISPKPNRTGQNPLGEEIGVYGIGFCGFDETSEISLEVVYPLTDEEATESEFSRQRRTIPPSAVILKASRPYAFFNDSWKLKIKYKYQRLETFKISGDGDGAAETVSPLNIDGENSPNKFLPSAYTVTHVLEATNISVESVGGLQSRSAAKVMAFIIDEDTGRVQTAAATKLVMQGQTLGCRSVDIKYHWISDAKGFNLEPQSGFFTFRGVPSVAEAGDGFIHNRKPLCGDHECGMDNCIGPVWFPFNDCTSVTHYDVINGAASCFLPIIEGTRSVNYMGVGAWRYCLPDEYEAWVSPAGQWAAECGPQFHFHYSQSTGEARWGGWGYKRAKVDKQRYDLNQWHLPPFGNTGRGYIERYLTRDYISFVDMSGWTPVINSEFMPMVFDKEDLSYELNCFAHSDELSNLNEPFTHFSLLSHYTSGFVSENISQTRTRFEDLIEPVHHAGSYPLPLVPIFGNTFYRVTRYGLKLNSAIWAWPEYWKEIERNVTEEEDGKFNFLTIIRPDYEFDVNKEEHRLITDEGEHVIGFIPPSQEGGNETDDGPTKVYPAIYLDNPSNKRFFQIVYEDIPGDEENNGYTSENVEWKDESETGEEGSSGGDSTIYEKANNGPTENGISGDNDPQWMHDFDTIFDPTASENTDDDRKYYVGEDEYTGEDKYAYYNCGLIANIPRNRLIYLPISKDIADDPTEIYTKLNSDGTVSEYIAVWKVEEYGKVPVTVELSGVWGIFEGSSPATINLYSRPGVSVVESEEDLVYDDQGYPSWSNSGGVNVGYLAPLQASYLSSTENYEIYLELTRWPHRMVKTLKYFSVTLFPEAGEKMDFSDLSIELGEYTKAEERIKVWERKYYPGLAGGISSRNADGPNTDKYRKEALDNKNGGQYFPFDDRFVDNENSDFESGGSVISKLNMVNFTEIYREDEPLVITKDTLKTVEHDAQRELYEEAYYLQGSYDTLSFNGILHPALDEWLQKINLKLTRPASMQLEYDRVDWEHNDLKNALVQDGDFIEPGGHYFAWSDYSEERRCYLFGGINDVYFVDWVHHKHGDSVATMDAGHSYVGWVTYQYLNAKLEALSGLGHGPPKVTDPKVRGQYFGGSTK